VVEGLEVARTARQAEEDHRLRLGRMVQRPDLAAARGRQAGRDRDRGSTKVAGEQRAERSAAERQA